jgi:hypothetical protein
VSVQSCVVVPREREIITNIASHLKNLCLSTLELSSFSTKLFTEVRNLWNTNYVFLFSLKITYVPYVPYPLLIALMISSYCHIHKKPAPEIVYVCN